MIGGAVDELLPMLLAQIPDTRRKHLEIWVQDAPALYRVSSSNYSDADGFWAEGPGRIHLRASAENLRRTLAHELVHASLGASWQALPGTIEEGLCDVISAQLCPEGSAHMRGGRLLSAGFATGGVPLELEIVVPADIHPLGIRATLNTRLRLEGDPPMRLDPLEVFRVQAGLSSTTVASEVKKACYGLGFLVVERILDRHGIDGLHALCKRARDEERARIPEQWLLEAAELTPDPAAWQQAAIAALGPAELEELVRAHPEFLLRTLTSFCSAWPDPAALEAALPRMHARIRLPGGTASLSLLDMPEIRERLTRNWVAEAIPLPSRP